ncbi:MAG: hypothetical protein IJX63_12965 [Lachnospiraceae bacterium]|nr:hypothetical protein [Lachnospiraceae bacterium]
MNCWIILLLLFGCGGKCTGHTQGSCGCEGKKACVEAKAQRCDTCDTRSERECERDSKRCDRNEDSCTCAGNDRDCDRDYHRDRDCDCDRGRERDKDMWSPYNGGREHDRSRDCRERDNCECGCNN